MSNEMAPSLSARPGRGYRLLKKFQGFSPLLSLVIVSGIFGYSIHAKWPKHLDLTGPATRYNDYFYIFSHLPSPTTSPPLSPVEQLNSDSGYSIYVDRTRSPMKDITGQSSQSLRYGSLFQTAPSKTTWKDADMADNVPFDMAFEARDISAPDVASRLHNKSSADSEVIRNQEQVLDEDLPADLVSSAISETEKGADESVQVGYPHSQNHSSDGSTVETHSNPQESYDVGKEDRQVPEGKVSDKAMMPRFMAALLNSSKAGSQMERRVRAVPGSGFPWKSEYVEDVTVDVANEPKCRRLTPQHPYHNSSLPPITQLSHLDGQRVMVFVPRFGLGNSLRGYVSSAILALLSGRRLVRLQGGDHYQIYDTLCEAFECGLDAIRWEENWEPASEWNEMDVDPKLLWLQFMSLDPFMVTPKNHKTSMLLDVLSSDQPIVATKLGGFFDGYWYKRRVVRECIYAAFKCKDVWCVHSRVAHMLLGKGPTSKLGAAIEDVLKHQQLKQSNLPLQALKVGREVYFDVAIHLRTRTLRIEKESLVIECANETCVAEVETLTSGMDNRYTRRPMWKCIHLAIKRLSSSLPRGVHEMVKERGLRIFLATDNEILRPIFVNRLEALGTVYFSSGVVVHTGRIDNNLKSRNALPTLAEFYLMGRSHILLEVEPYISSFAYFAGLMSNGTVAALDTKRDKCKVRIQHVGDPRYK